MSRISDVFFEFVQIDSPSGSEEAMREKLRHEFSKQGCNAHVDPRGNLRLFLPGTLDAPCRLFSAHMDTVEPGRGIRPFLDGDGTIRSDGTTILGADDKDGITAFLCALERIGTEKCPHPPLEFLFTVCEENNLDGAKYLEKGFLKSRIGWIFDGPGPLGTIYRNGVGKWGCHVELTGRSAHSALMPEKGINAMVAAADAILSFPPGRFRGATVNYGTIRGGIADNIVPENVTVTAEIRAKDMKSLRAIGACFETAWQTVAKRHGCRISIVGTDGYPPFVLPPDSPHYRETRFILESIGLDVNLAEFNAACDANFLCATGMDICVVATGRTANHTCAETTTLKNLERLTDMAYGLMTAYP